MRTAFIDPLKTTIAVKGARAVSGNVYVLDLMNGSVFSCMKGGFPDERPSNFDGGNERCRINGNTATFLVEGVYYVFAFVEVDGL